ncbi:hypothetical protein GOP47_0024713 [Adiantum capillus-veneris]|uniref:Uncharacterized protein n=1 Tax=Adiantum capillus-veneris TaxID=13818 RepID=A0A9D4Z2X0_ADICA|nr:hypothetical protein GOP47_0024713 [Adiantum capillus-veneris]
MDDGLGYCMRGGCLGWPLESAAGGCLGVCLRALLQKLFMVTVLQMPGDEAKLPTLPLVLQGIERWCRLRSRCEAERLAEGTATQATNAGYFKRESRRAERAGNVDRWGHCMRRVASGSVWKDKDREAPPAG